MFEQCIASSTHAPVDLLQFVRHGCSHQAAGPSGVCCVVVVTLLLHRVRTWVRVMA